MERQETYEPRRFKKRYIVLILLLVGLVWFAFFRISAYRDLNRRLGALRGQNYPMSVAELERLYNVPPEGDNATDYYLAAFSYYTPSEDEAREGLPWVSRSVRPGRTEPLTPEIRRQSEQFLAANEKTLSLLHEAAAFDASRYPINFTKGGIETPWLSEVRKHAFLLSLQSLVACERDDPNQALECVRAGLELARWVDSPVIICRLVQIAVRALVYRNIEQILNRLTLTDEQLRTLSAWVEQSRNVEGSRQAFIGERCVGLDIFRGRAIEMISQDVSQDKWIRLLIVPRKILGLHDRDMLGYINYLQEHIDMVDLPAYERLVKCRSLEKEMESPGQRGFLTRMIVPAMRRVTELEIRAEASWRVTRTALAIERYRLAEGRVSQSLADLVPTYLDAVPKDPFDGQNLRYRLLETGYVVYSISEDLSDDRGAEKDDQKRDAEGRVLWDVTFYVER